MITKTQTPYEFLVRWKDGKIAGAYFKWFEKVIDDDGVTVLSEKEGMAQPVSMAGEAGYPIADIFAAINSASVATAQAAVTAVADALAKQADADAAKVVSEAAQAAAKTAADAAEAENKRLADAQKVAADKVTFDAAVAAKVAAVTAA